MLSYDTVKSHYILSYIKVIKLVCNRLGSSSIAHVLYWFPVYSPRWGQMILWPWRTLRCCVGRATRLRVLYYNIIHSTYRAAAPWTTCRPACCLPSWWSVPPLHRGRRGGACAVVDVNWQVWHTHQESEGICWRSSRIEVSEKDWRYWSSQTVA